MCFYDQVVFKCKDYKWGQFRQQCSKEYRSGETCGMKLTFRTLADPRSCKICEKIVVKMNRRIKAESNIRRWHKEGGRNASIEKAEDELDGLDAEIHMLENERRYKNRCL